MTHRVGSITRVTMVAALIVALIGPSVALAAAEFSAEMPGAKKPTPPAPAPAVVTAPAISAVSNPALPAVLLDDERIVALAEPAVVRVIHHVTGTATVAAFDVDLMNFKVIPSTKWKDPIDIPLDEYMLGSGYVVDASGLIVTNAHVMSMKVLQFEIAAPFYLMAIEAKSKKLSKADEAKMEAMDPDELQEKMLDLLYQVVEKITFDATEKFVIARPAGSSQTPKEAVEKGVAATIVAINEQFIDDGEDIAVLRVDQTGLPALRMGNGSLAVGQKVFVFGYPGNAEQDSDKLESEPTFTKGIVNAIKDSDKGSFKKIQTDAKISGGSSGGPMLYQNGMLRGMMTQQTSPLKGGGDNFAFAIPVDVIMKWIPKSSELLAQQGYADALIAGWQSAEAAHCKMALTQFAHAKSFTPIATAHDKFIDPAIASCTALIAAGKSIDPEEKTPLFSFAPSLSLVFFALGFLALAGGLAVMIIRYRADESAILKLETKLAEETASHGIVHAAPQVFTASGPDQAIVSTPKSEIPTERFNGAPEARSTPPPVVAQSLPVQPVLQTSAPVVASPVLAAQPVATSPIPTSSAPLNPDLLAYIASARQVGAQTEAIRSALTSAGWDRNDVDRALLG